MDVFNLDIASIPLTGLLKMLLKLFELLAAKGTGEAQRGTAIKNEYIANSGKYTVSFINDLRDKTEFFLKSYFKEEDLAQILGKQEPPKQVQNRSYR